MATTEFYNSGKQIRIVFIAGPNSGIEYRIPKTIFTFYKVNSAEFHIKGADIGIYVLYSEVSTTNPPGHASIDDLFEIFRVWCLDASTGGDDDYYDDLHRTRVVSPVNVFEWAFRHDTEPRKFNTLTSSGGTVTFMPNEQYTELQTPAATPTSRALIQSKKYVPFQEGKSFQVEISAVLRTTLAITDNTVKLGYFDDINDKNVAADQSGSGVFIQLDASGALSLVRRSYVSGTQTDTTAAQSAWNIDKLDGAGISGFTLDPTKLNNYVFEFIMDASCNIRFGVMSGHGDIYYAHRFTFANVLATGGIFNATLPVRVENTAGVTGNGATSTTKLFSGAVISEGGKDEYYNDMGTAFSADSLTALANAVVVKSSGEIKPVISIRLKQTRCRTTIHPLSFMMLNFKDNSQFKYRIVLNATLTGATWTAGSQLPADSAAEVDIGATAVSGGTTLISGYCSSSSERVSFADMKARLELYSSIDGATCETMTLVIEYINVDAQVLGDFQWIEYN